MQKFGRPLLLLWLLCKVEPLVACASCGSGGDDPIILYPNEPQKLYAAVSDESGFRKLQYDGDAVRDAGVLRKRALVLGYGYLVSPRAFVTATAALRMNYGATRQKAGYGDPTVGYRHALVTQTFDAPYVPQVQLVAGFKPGLAKGTDNATDPELLDAFGSGHHEVRAGVDMWSGMTWLQYGVSTVAALPIAKKVDGKTDQPGLRQTTTVSAARTGDHWKAVTGVTRTQTARRIYRGDLVARSDAQQTSAYLTFDWKTDDVTTWRATAVFTGALPRSYNSYSSRIVQLAYMKVVP